MWNIRAVQLQPAPPLQPSSAFGAGVHPDIPNFLTYVVGRARGGRRVPDWADSTAEGRPIQIAQCGCLHGHTVYGTSWPVVCFSEVSLQAIATLFTTGVTFRGPYAPWALLFWRDPMLERGVRPIWPMSYEQIAATDNMSPSMRDFRVAFVPGQVDWSHEREWRYCWGDRPVTGCQLPGVLAAVVTPVPGWVPPTGPGWFAGAGRWLWTGSSVIYNGIF